MLNYVGHWYFIFWLFGPISGEPVQLGPFNSESACNAVRQELAATAREGKRSSITIPCWKVDP